ncbi:hypothetical protein HRbin36_02262 [bacterium HR36]|nr:hypothetical protein HRbin36_02262 [bacterium HR36]
MIALGCGHQDYARLQRALLQHDLPPGPSTDLPSDYQVGPGDVLAIRFNLRPEWNGEYLVWPHGCIVLPEAGALPVHGHTTDEIAELIREQSADEVGLVFVEVRRFENQQVYLFGEIQGGSRAIPYHGPETLAQLLQRAGGLTPDADPTSIRVHRLYGSNGEEEIIRVNLLAVLYAQDRQQNIYIRPYDRIVVSRNSWACLRACLPRAWKNLLSAGLTFQNGNGLYSSP